MIKDIFRSNTQLFPVGQLVSTVTLLYMLYLTALGLVAPQWWLASLAMYFCTGCLGITITYHRYLTHRSFKYRYKWMEYVFSFFGAMGGTGSSIGWVAVHNEHHKHTDKDGDPHSPHLGFWNVIIPRYTFDMNKFAVRHLVTNKFHLALHNYYYLIMLAWIGLLYIIGGTNLAIFVGVIPVAIQIWASVMSNYGNHTWGYRNFETKEESKNTWWLAILTFGEGWHNNHHAKPGRWNFSYKWWEIDMSAWVIRLLKTS